MEIVPSLLSADFSKLAEEIRAVERAGARRLHLDVMDGHFVPNLTIGPFIVSAIRKHTRLHLETHLMIDNHNQFIDKFIDAGADTVIIHIEVSDAIERDLEKIRKGGAKAGLVLNPATPFSAIEPYLQYADHLLIMTVNPGFGGQTIIPDALEKVRLAKSYSQQYNFPIEVDGGIHIETIADVKAAGTDLFVAGSAVFSNPDPCAAYKALSEILVRA
jgi:ribulose-phosphate 3-epimerase